MFSNVLWSWGGYLVTILAGFVMPRLIDYHIGQLSLGIWDFCWSLISYLALSGLGVGSSVNRFVAKYRMSGDTDSLCKAVSSVAFIQLNIAVFVVLFTVLLTLALPYYFSSRLGNETVAAQWVVASLGLSFAVQMAADTSRGIITGCHRWDIHNRINVFSTVIIFIGMVVALSLGNGLRALGIVVLFAGILTESLRVVIAHLVCPEVRFRLSFVKWSVTKVMVFFGGKTVIASLSPLILLQTTNILLVSTIGPAALAVFSRPIALVRHIGSLMNKFSFIATPTAGALQESGQDAELRRFLLDTVRYGVAIVFPITLFLIFFSDAILTIWMGSKYAYGKILTVLAIGFFLSTSQSAVMRILMGMNLHGRIGGISFLTNLILFALGAVIVSMTGWSLVKAALIIAIPISIGDGIMVPIYACRKFQIPLLEYIRHVFYAPFICSLVLSASFFLGRILFSKNIYTSLSFGIFTGGLITGIFYWQYILTERIRIKIIKGVFQIFPQF